MLGRLGLGVTVGLTAALLVFVALHHVGCGYGPRANRSGSTASAKRTDSPLRGDATETVGTAWSVARTRMRIGVAMTSTDQPGPQAEIERETAALRRRSATVTIARGISYVAYAWIVVSLIILAFGFMLLLLNANPDAAFTQWVYRHLTDTMEPFRGIFPQATTPSGSTLDVSVLFAMLVYSLVGLGVRSVIDWLTYRRDRLERTLLRDQALLRRWQLAQQRQHQQQAAPTIQQQQYPTQSAPRYPEQ